MFSKNVRDRDKKSNMLESENSPSFSSIEYLEKSLKQHLSNMYRHYSSSKGFNKMKNKWDKLLRPEILEFTTSSIIKNIKDSLLNLKHNVKSQSFGYIYIVVSTLPVINTIKAKTYFSNGYFGFMDSQIQKSNYGIGNIDLAHWIICCDGKEQAIHLTFMVATKDQGFGAINVLAQDLMTDSEKLQAGIV